MGVYCNTHAFPPDFFATMRAARRVPSAREKLYKIPLMLSRISFMLRALSYRNYRLFFGGQIVSLIGSWMTLTATNWLVYRLTGSAFLLGVVGFAGQFPAFFLGPFAGIVVDRWDRHRLLVVTQTISMLQSFALAVLVFSGRITLEWIVAL